jgi:signal transduction histidine kinase
VNNGGPGLLESNHNRQSEFVLKKFFRPVWKIINDYPAVVTAVVIYVYYLITSVNYFAHASQKKTFLDYLLQFDSLIWMWLAAVAWLQVQSYRKRQQEETAKRQIFEYELQLQQVQNAIIDDITNVLQDSINNPLTIISLKTQEIRRKFEEDSEIVRLLETIEAAMRRIEQTVRDLKTYETQKMMQTSAERLSQIQTPQANLFPKDQST